MADPRVKPMTPEEVEELLKATLHGPLPQKTVYRMMATLAVWMDLPEQLDKALCVLTLRRRPDDTSPPYVLEREICRLLRQLEHFRVGEAIPDKTWEQELDLALERLEHTRGCLQEAVALMEATRHGEYTPDSFTTQPWLKVLKEGALEGEPEPEQSELAYWRERNNEKITEIAELRHQLEQARKAADGCPLRSADTGKYECPVFPPENQAADGSPES